MPDAPPPPKPPVAPALDAEGRARIRAAVRGAVSFDPVIRGIHATDASHYQVTPACVVVPLDEDDCVAAIQVAAELKLPITPRGAATALSGQTFGPGMVIDVSRHLNQVLEVNAEEGWARVQPGVVRDHLNAEVASLGLQFAPDPATSSRATIGGMVGNNSSGTRSIVYGKTIDHVLGCKVALDDGTVLDCGPMDDDAWQAKAAGSSREGQVYRGVRDLVLRHQDAIRERYPKVMRRVTGYNLDTFVDGAGYVGPIGPRAEQNAGHRPWDLTHLIVGSEGTLGVVLEVTVRLVPRPAATALCIVHFDDDLDALRAVPGILEYGPSAVELLDRGMLRESTVNPATRDMAGWVAGDPAAVLLTEFFGSDAQDAQSRAQHCAAALDAAGVGYARPVLADAASQHNVWETRKLGLGLISNVRGPVKGQAFVEDACVPVEHLPDYIAGLQAHCRRLDLDYAMYAHASVGVIHFRPAVDLHRDDHRRAMQAIAETAFLRVVELGGAFAGEHGDGVVRGAFVPRFFGDELYGAFRSLKALFDPHHQMNPGKIVDAPSMTDGELLRYGDAYRVTEVPALFRHQQQDGFRGAVEQCNGVGACRKLGSGTMCPSYMATRDEKDTTRGRANALRLAMSGQLGDAQDVTGALASDAVHEVLDLCLSCKACKSECPNAVDMARLKADALQMRHERHGVPLGARLIGGMPDAARWMRGPLAELGRAIDRFGPYRRVFERLTGIDRRRPLPGFARRHLPALLKERAAKAPAPPRPDVRPAVVLFDDTTSRSVEPAVGLAAVELLEGCGYRVIVANAGCCQRPRLSQGLLHAAKQRGAATMAKLDVFARQGLPILCLEPSCASALADDLPDLIDDQALGQRVAAQVSMIDVFLDAQGVALTCDHPRVLLHGHCHQKALFGTGAIRRLFAAMPQTQCTEVDAGCCGMAGAFGYNHHDLSQIIGEDRLFPAVRAAHAAGDVVVACGVSCRHQIDDFLGVRAQHWVQVVRPQSPVGNATP